MHKETNPKLQARLREIDIRNAIEELKLLRRVHAIKASFARRKLDKI